MACPRRVKWNVKRTQPHGEQEQQTSQRKHKVQTCCARNGLQQPPNGIVMHTYGSYLRRLWWGLQEMRTVHAKCFILCLAQSTPEMLAAIIIFKDFFVLVWDESIKWASWGYSEPKCLTPNDVRPPKAFKCNYKKITFPAINHQYKFANTYHCHIMTHRITRSECRVERGPFVADLIQVKSAQSIQSQWKFCLSEGQDHLRKGVINQGDVFEDIRSY